MKARLKDLVRTPSGEVLTLEELAARGEVTCSVSERFSTSGRSAPRRAYFADHVSGAGSWEIGKRDHDTLTAALEARAAQNEWRRGRGVYGEWCRDPQKCQERGFCPLEPTCAD